MSTVLVTGATGFIGRRLVARLAKDGHRVRALVLPGEDAAGLAGVDVSRGDVTDPESVAHAVRGAGRVYHLAAVVGDWGDEERFERINVGGTRNVLDAAAASGVERVVMVSSIVVYGSQLRTGPCDESAPREHGIGPYSRTKRASEEVALDYDAFGRVPVTVVRPGNVFGPASPLWVDELAQLLKKGAAMWLDDGDGDADLAFVDNVVDVIARAAETPDAAGRIYNATDGLGVTWKQYLTDLAAAAGAPAPHRHLPAGVATAVGAAMESAWRLARASHRPLFTREAAQLLASRAPVPNARAASELGYVPIPYGRAMESVSHYLEGIS
ncbi:MAG TPA: NAD-dependent epimerase/dehydratase family protein [Kofleriaceae bacterium]|nr:NAD-dependent epimerase/dehydratase family protein [Kofleriaceae bacterium]